MTGTTRPSRDGAAATDLSASALAATDFPFPLHCTDPHVGAQQASADAPAGGDGPAPHGTSLDSAPPGEGRNR